MCSWLAKQVFWNFDGWRFEILKEVLPEAIPPTESETINEVEEKSPLFTDVSIALLQAHGAIHHLGSHRVFWEVSLSFVGVASLLFALLLACFRFRFQLLYCELLSGTVKFGFS